MANTDVHLNLVGGTAKLQTSQGNGIGKVTLEYDDTLTVKLGSGFSGTTTLTSVEIFNWVNGSKGSSLGSWPTSNDIGVLNVSLSGSNVVVKDNDKGASDGDYGYSVSATSVKDGRSSVYTADPELVAKKKRTGGTGQTTNASSGPKPEAEI